MLRAVLMGTLALLTAAACTSTVDGVKPVGGDEPSVAELERYVRRLHLDLSAEAPAQAASDDAVARLQTDDSAATRLALADELLAAPEFARTFVSELENEVFAGDTLEGQYDFYCSIIRVDSTYPDCNACPPSADPCADCTCYLLQDLYDERAVLRASADDLTSGARTSSAVERAYAGAMIYRFAYGDPAALATSLFENFLGRAAEPEELMNAQNMVFGALLGPEYPAGLLFHRHGSSYDDLVDIVFDDEAYREAMVDAAFQRYLGRAPSAEERNHFAAQLDAGDPDIAPVVRAVVASREYFEQ